MPSTGGMPVFMAAGMPELINRESVMTNREIEVAHVEDFFNEISVAALKITAGTLRIGDVLHFKGHTTDLLQEVSSMQVDHNQVKRAEKGDVVGIKVLERVRQHDKVFKVVLEERF